MDNLKVYFDENQLESMLIIFLGVYLFSRYQYDDVSFSKIIIWSVGLFIALMVLSCVFDCSKNKSNGKKYKIINANDL
jgi:hypothetical protein